MGTLLCLPGKLQPSFRPLPLNTVLQTPATPPLEALRSHIVSLMANLPAFLLGFPLETLAGLIAFRGVWAIYIHSNVRLPIGPFRMLVGAPELHHWHHDRDRDFGNYANISPLMDLIFGTYRCPDHEPESLGIAEPIPRSYLGQLLHPFLPRKASAPLVMPPIPIPRIEEGCSEPTVCRRPD